MNNKVMNLNDFMFNITETFKKDSLNLTELVYEFIKSVINNDQ